MPIGTRLTGAKTAWYLRYAYSGGNVPVRVQEVDTFLFPAKAGATDGDYCVQYDASGNGWAVALDTTGAAAATPTGAIWVSIPAARKVYLDVHSTSTAAQMATAVKAGFNALPGFTAVMTASDAAADGHLANTATGYKALTAPVVKTKDDGGSGSISVSVTTAGVAYIALSPVVPGGLAQSTTPDAANRLEVYDNSGRTLVLAVGAAGVEKELCVIPPGGIPFTVDCLIPNGSRVVVGALDSAATTGALIITGIQ